MIALIIMRYFVLFYESFGYDTTSSMASSVPGDGKSTQRASAVQFAH